MVLRRGAVAAVLTLLVVVQTWAMVTQVARGFRPFGHPPTRVPYSWDMFSVDIERCGVEFDPPVTYRGHTARTLTAPLAPFEWDYIAGRQADYARMAQTVCNKGTATLTCFSGRGRSQQTIDCS